MFFNVTMWKALISSSSAAADVTAYAITRVLSLTGSNSGGVALIGLFAYLAFSPTTCLLSAIWLVGERLDYLPTDFLSWRARVIYAPILSPAEQGALYGPPLITKPNPTSAAPTTDQ